MNDMISFDSDQLPAHISRMFSGSNDDLQGGLFPSYPVVSIKGKVFHIVEKDKRTLVKRPGQEDPASSIEVVILKANPNKSKLYYEGGYEEGSTAKPTCYSDDSITPAADVQVRQNPVCATCTRNVWGSRVTEAGAKSRECSDSRRLAIAPEGRLDMPMLLRVPAGSLNDLGSYATQLDGRRFPYHGVVTKISFNHDVAHPKLGFKAVRLVTEEEADKILATRQKDIIQQIVGIHPNVTPTDGESAPVQSDAAPPATSPPKTRAAKAVVTEDEIEQAVAPVTIAKKANSTTPKKAAPPAKEVETPKSKPKYDESALLAEADASLDEALAALDD